MRRFLLIPVWLLTLCIKPLLPFSHPWKQKSLTLQWWVDGATDDAVISGAVFWIQSIFLAWVLVIIYVK